MEASLLADMDSDFALRARSNSRLAVYDRQRAVFTSQTPRISTNKTPTATISEISPTAPNPPQISVPAATASISTSLHDVHPAHRPPRQSDTSHAVDPVFAMPAPRPSQHPSAANLQRDSRPCRRDTPFFHTPSPFLSKIFGAATLPRKAGAPVVAEVSAADKVVGQGKEAAGRQHVAFDFGVGRGREAVKGVDGAAESKRATAMAGLPEPDGKGRVGRKSVEPKRLMRGRLWIDDPEEEEEEDADETEEEDDEGEDEAG